MKSLIVMSALTDALYSYMSGDFIDGRTAAYLNTSTNIATAIAIGIGGLVMSWDYLKNSLLGFDDGKEGKLFDPFVLGKILFFLFILQSYPYTIKPVLNYFNEINQSYAQSEASYDNYQAKLEQELLIKEKAQQQILDEAKNDPELNQEEKDLMNESLGHAQEDPNSDKGFFGSMEETLTGINRMIADPRVFVAQVFHWLANILIFIIRPVVKVFAFYSIKLLTVLGPFAIAFSLLPGFSGQLAKWFGRLANLLFASIMFTILDSLFMDTLADITIGVSTNSMVDGMSTNPNDPAGWSYMFNVIAFDLAVVALYLSPFFLASAIVGSGDGGSMVSKTIGIGSAAAGMMTTAVTGGTSAIATAATGVPVNVGGGKGGGDNSNPLKKVS